MNAIKPKKTKVAAAAYPVPQTIDDADEAIRQLGLLQRRRTVVEVQLNEGLEALKAAAEASVQPINAEIAGLVHGLQTFCAANRDTLTKQGKVKRYAFGAGVVSWRKRPPKVSLRNVEEILKALKGLGLHRFIRTKEEVNKEAMLAEPLVAGAVSGVKIGSEGEDFVVAPNLTELEEVAP